MARYFHWPRSLIDARWDEIEEFAALDEVANRARYRTLRLAVSAALHMDATLYVVDNSLQDDGAFATRCLDLVAQRKAEGAAVIQAGRRFVEGVAGLSDEVIWIETERWPTAVARSRSPPSCTGTRSRRWNRMRVPVTALLADGQEPVRIGPGPIARRFRGARPAQGARARIRAGARPTSAVASPSCASRSAWRLPSRASTGSASPSPRVSSTSGRTARGSRSRSRSSGTNPLLPASWPLSTQSWRRAAATAHEEDLPVGFVFLPVADVELDESDDATWDVSRIGS